MTAWPHQQQSEIDRPDRRRVSDSQRDAEKYRQLVRALRHATAQIRAMSDQKQVDLETVLINLLPDIAAAFNAQSAFVVRQVEASPGQQPSLVLLEFTPRALYEEEMPRQIPLLSELIIANQPRVIESLDDQRTDHSADFIPGLEFCRATSAILVPVCILDYHYAVALCNKADPLVGPFLASDRMTLDNLLELIAVGARASEGRRRELESIEEISRIALTGTPREVADAIVQQAVIVTHSRYAAVWTVNKHTLQVEFLTIHHATEPLWRPPQLMLDLDETSFIGFVALHGKALNVQDVEQTERFLRWDRQTQSAFCLPLILNQQVLGVLYIASAVMGGINSDRRRFLEQLAPHAAIALHNARQSAIRQWVIRFQYEISEVMPLDQQFDQILEHLRQQVYTGGLFLAMYNPDNNEITYPIVFDRDQAIGPALKQPGAFYGPQAPGTQRFSFVEWVLQHRTTLLVENFNTSPYRHSIDLAARRGVKSCLVVPLIRQQRIVGVIGLRSYFETRGNFDEYGQHFMEGIADQIAIILNNSQHYDLTQQALEVANLQLSERVQALRAVSEFQRRISDIDEEAQELQNIYRVAREAMAGVGLDVSNMYIALYAQDENTITFPLAYEQGQPIDEEAKQFSALYRSTTFGEHRSVAEWIMQRWQTEGVRDALLIEANFKAWISKHDIDSFETGTQCWLGAPLICKEKLLGMIGLRSPEREYVFKEEHKELLETIASQAAIALENARLYDVERRNVSQFRALHEAGKAITRAGLALDDVLHEILIQAVQVTGSFFGTIQLARDGYLEFVAAWPKAKETELQQRFGRMSLDGPGVTVRAARLNDAQLITNVHLAEDYLDATGETGSAIAVVLRHSGEQSRVPLGVLNVEHHEIGGLTRRERSVLIGLANLAVVAVENAQNADQFSRTNAIAVMGAWGADIVHDIQREVGVIRLTIDTLRGEESVSPAVLHQRLNEIDAYIQNLVMPPLPERIPTADGETFMQESVPIDTVIQAEIAAMRQRHGSVTFTLLTACPGVEATIHEQWLRRLLRHLVINSVRANEKGPPLTITVGTTLHSGFVEIAVQDNGRGIRPEIEPYLFHRPVPHQGKRSDERHGRGLLLVRHIVELHGGSAHVKWNQTGQGACVAFTLPCV